MQFWKKLLSCAAIALATCLAGGCARDNAAMATMALSSARIEQRGGNGWLAAEGDWKPSTEMLEALDHGIALTLVVQLQEQQHRWFGWYGSVEPIERHLELRYFPLTRRYQLRDVELGMVHSFGVRAAAIAALGHLELPLDPATSCAAVSASDDRSIATERYRLRIEFDAAALPGALRLPALVLAAWQQPRAEWTWPCATAA